jgi:acyl-CoA synthetase (AMP-forming)/AMP-acid ligase II
MQEAIAAEMLLARARDAPEDEAFTFLDARLRISAQLSYGELDRRARRVAAEIVRRGGAGRPVLLTFPPSLDFIVAAYGCFYAGAIATPTPGLLPNRAFERVGAIVHDSGATLGLTLSTFAAAGDDAYLDPASPDWIELDRLGGDPTFKPRPGELALLQYTSGTTSSPRGVEISNANIADNVRAHMDFSEPNRQRDREVCWLPMYHDMGFLLQLIFPVAANIPSTLMSPLTFLQRPIRWLQAVSQYGGTLTAAPCFAYGLTAVRSNEEERAALNLSKLRRMICGAEVIRPEMLEGFAAAFAVSRLDAMALAPCYGLAEATLGVSVALGTRVHESVEDPSSPRRQVVCGLPIPGMQAAIVDPDTRRRVAAGAVGEIWLQGPSVARGYWRRPEETKETFRVTIAEEEASGHWLRTGDLGLLSPEGLVIAGRRKDMINVRGANFDPLDLEVRAVEALAAVRTLAAAAFAVDTSVGEAAVVAIEIAPSKSSSFDREAAAQAVAAEMTRKFGLKVHEVVFVRVGALPRTTSGKIQRGEARKQYLEGLLSPL